MKTYIITLTWNNSDDFERYVKSLGYNTMIPVELVVIENGSEPEERRAIQSACEHLYHAPWACLDGAHYHELPENIGLPAAQNKALDWIEEHEQGPYGIVLLDADTVPGFDWLTKILAFADGHKDIGIISGGRSPGGHPCPVYHNPNGRWYTRDGQYTHPSGFMEGEGVDFACAYIRPELLARGLRFDTGYHFYGSHDPDMCFRVRSWGYRVWAFDAGVDHYASSVMKSRGYQWSGGGKKEWDALRAKNCKRFAEIWKPFLAPHRSSIEQEIEHMARMNDKLVAEAGDRKAVPSG